MVCENSSAQKLDSIASKIHPLGAFVSFIYVKSWITFVFVYTYRCNVMYYYCTI